MGCFLQVLSFLRQKEGFLSLVLKHIDTSAMMDVLLRLISCVEPPPLRLETLTVRHKQPKIHNSTFFAGTTCYFSQQWLNEEKLAQRLIELIHPERDEEVEAHFRIFIRLSNSFMCLKHTASSSHRFQDRHLRVNHFCFCFFCCRDSPMHLRLCVTSFVWAETRPVSSKRCHSLILCWLCLSRKLLAHTHPITRLSSPFRECHGNDTLLCVPAGRGVWSSCCRICFQESALRAVL